MASSETLAPLWIFARGLFSVATTLFVWLCLFTQILAMDTLRTSLAPADEASCAQPAMSFLLFASILWAAAILVVSYDAFRLRRGKLSVQLKWLRTAPALLTVLIPPAFVLFMWASQNW